MRSIRTAAVAGATALAVTFGGVAVASAQDQPTGSSVNVNQDQDGNATVNAGAGLSGSSEAQDGNVAITGAQAFGVDALPSSELPKWWQTWSAVTIVTGILAALGTLAFPAYNFLRDQGILG